MREACGAERGGSDRDDSPVCWQQESGKEEVNIYVEKDESLTGTRTCSAFALLHNIKLFFIFVILFSFKEQGGKKKTAQRDNNLQQRM